MSNAPTRPFEMARPHSGPTFDMYLILPVLACAYVVIISPLLLRADTGPLAGGMWTEAQGKIIIGPRLEHKLFWPGAAAITIVLAIRFWSRLTLPLHVKALFAHLAFAGASVLWAFKPEFSSVRFAQQAMIIISIVIPALLAARTADMLRAVFLSFAAALIINLFFVLDQNPMILGVRICYPGYFTFKGILGECAAVAFLLALHEILYPGWRRRFGIVVIGIAVYLVIMSDSKGSLALALPAPFLAGIILLISKNTRISPALVLLPIPIIYTILSKIVGNLVGRVSWYVYGNYDLSGRVFIWDFANFEIARRPLLGWGYQSFWLVGPDAPSVVDAPGWIKMMPSSHNGYLDTMVDMGYVGLVLLLIFIFTTLHAIGRVADRNPARGWILLTLALYIIITNFIETGWMHGFDPLWLIFLIVAAETGRHCRSFPSRPPESMRDSAVAQERQGMALARGSQRLGQL